MLDKWVKIGKRRKRLIEKIIALDSRRSIEQLSRWSIENLERELSLLKRYPKEKYPNIYQHHERFVQNRPDDGDNDGSRYDAEFKSRIDRLRNHAKANGIWDGDVEENPKKGKWV